MSKKQKDITAKQNETAQSFIDIHNPLCFAGLSLEKVYFNLVGGLYGECRKVFDDHKLYEIEVSKSDTKSGNPSLFTFRLYDEESINNE